MNLDKLEQVRPHDARLEAALRASAVTSIRANVAQLCERKRCQVSAGKRVNHPAFKDCLCCINTSLLRQEKKTLIIENMHGFLICDPATKPNMQ